MDSVWVSMQFLKGIQLNIDIIYIQLAQIMLVLLCVAFRFPVVENMNLSIKIMIMIIKF